MAEFELGFLGGGQLARMSIQAAQRMGFRCLSLDPGEITPASQISPAIKGALDNPEALAAIFARCDYVTLENEFVPAKVIAEAMKMAGRTPDSITPGLDTLAMIQDKLTQRQALLKAGVPSPNAVALDQDGSLALAKIGIPMVLKARFGGYDGKGTRYARTAEEFDQYTHLWQSGGEWLAEDFVPFKRELAVMVVRSTAGTACFPTMETIQTNHVCDIVKPADVDASQVAIKAVEAVGGYGVFGVELFETQDGTFLINELAPRPHNSGHYSLDWGGASQFDQHIRAVLGLPPAPMDGIPTAMANILGIEGSGDWRPAAVKMMIQDPGARFHWYGKAEAKPGRKMGHINASGEDCEERVRAARETFLTAWKK